MPSRITVDAASDEAKKYAESGLKRAMANKGANEDASFYGVVVFQSKEQRDAFFSACKVRLDWSDYCDGVRLAEKLGITLPAAHAPSKVIIDESVMLGDE